MQHTVKLYRRFSPILIVPLNGNLFYLVMHPVLLRWISDDLDTATGDEVNGTRGAGTLPEDGVHDHAPRLKLDTFDLRKEEKKEEERLRKMRQAVVTTHDVSVSRY